MLLIVMLLVCLVDGGKVGFQKISTLLMEILVGQLVAGNVEPLKGSFICGFLEACGAPKPTPHT